MAAVCNCCHPHTRLQAPNSGVLSHGWHQRQRATGSTSRLQAAATAQQQQTTELMSIIPWAVRQKLKFAKIKPALLPGSGRGLVCLADIQPGECVCEVPITAALRVYPGCPAVLGVPSQLFQQLPWYGQLALTLLSEQQQGAASKWADYVRTLPAAVDAPVLWSEADVAQLQCPYFIQQVQQQQADWAALQQQVAPYLSAAGLSTQQLCWALSITRSRTFAAPYSSNPFGAQLGWLQKQAGKQEAPQQQQQHVMCPLLDLFNHAGDVQSECEFYSDFRSSAFRVVASQPWARGQEVFINYGGGSNDALLQLYGFVETGNREDRYIVRGLPAVLAEQGLTAGSTAALDEVVFMRQGLDAAAAQQLSQLLSEAAPSQSAGESSVPYSLLGPRVRSVCAATVQQELSTLAVEASADQEVLQAFDQLPAKQAELKSQQADLAKAQGRLQQLQQLLQESSQQQADSAAAAAAAEHQRQQQAPDDGQQQEAASPAAPSEATAELLATLELCQQLCDRLEGEVAELQGLIARWQQLVQQHKQLAVAFRLEKHLLLAGVLQELQAEAD